MNAFTAGMPWIRNAAARRWLASVSTLASAILPLARVDGLLEHGRELAAGAAPGGPEVDDDRQLLGALDDVLLEGGLGGVEDHPSRLPGVSEFTVTRAGVELSGEEAGEGVPVVLLHGLTATRRYVVMGSRALERGGHRVVSYDARGHGRSSARRRARRLRLRDARRRPARGARRPRDRARGAGGRVDGRAHDRPARARPWRPRRRARADHAGLHARGRRLRPGALGRARRRAAERRRRGLRRGLRRSAGARAVARDGHQGAAPAPRRPRASRRGRRRAARGAALAGVRGLERARGARLPTLVVASRDEADPGHPYAVGERYAAAIPGAELLSEEPGGVAARLAGRPALEGRSPSWPSAPADAPSRGSIRAISGSALSITVSRS